MRPRPGWMTTVDRLDRLMYRGEQWLCGAIFVGMIVAMAANVLHRVFSRPQGRLSAALLAILDQLGAHPDPAMLHGPVSTALNLALGFGMAVLAMRTSQATRQWRWPKALLAAAGLTATGAAMVVLLLVALPNGVVWGPALALAGMLWTGFLGASLATYEKKHLALELADKIWPAAWQRPIKGLALVLTTALCALLCALAWVSLREHLATWLHDPQAGILLPTTIPKWVLLTALPVAWTTIALRFLGEGLRVLVGLEAPSVDQDVA